MLARSTLLTFVAGLSLTASLSAATSDSLLLAVDPDGDGLVDFVRVHPDGSAGEPLIGFERFMLVDLEMAATVESRRYRPDLAKPIRLGGHDAVALADGSLVIMGALTRDNTCNLIRTYPNGQVEVIHAEVILEPEEPPILPWIVVSDFGPFLAFMLTESQEVFLYRTDGTDWSSTGSPLLNVTPDDAEIEPGSLVFGVETLIAIDEGCAFLIDLSNGSSNEIPLEYGEDEDEDDDEPQHYQDGTTVSGDGRTFAFAAGSEIDERDIYVVNDRGQWFDVTRNTRDYAGVGYSRPDRLVEISLNHDGSRVSYVDYSGFEPEVYTSDVVFPDPELMTSDEAFAGYVDVGTVFRFSEGDGVLMVAGADVESLDIYYSPTGEDTELVNLTRTSSLPEERPYFRDGKLRVLDMASHPVGSIFLAHVRLKPPNTIIHPSFGPSRDLSHTVGDRLLHIDGTTGQLSPLVESFSGLSAPLHENLLVAAAMNRLWVVDVETRQRQAFFLPEPVHELSVDSFQYRVATLTGPSPDNVDLWSFEPATGTLVPLTQGGQDLALVYAGLSPGDIHFLSRSSAQSGYTLMRYTDTGGVEDLGLDDVVYFFHAPR